MGKYLIQLHDASHLHYDFRLEIGGVLKSWAIPKGPSMVPKDKRLAIMTPDHALSYGSFEGVIPKGEYGAGVVLLWDKGRFKNIRKDAKGKSIPLEKCLADGRLEIEIEGEKLKGGFALVHFRESNWLLIKMRDGYAREGYDVVAKKPKSVKSEKTLTQLKRFYASQK